MAEEKTDAWDATQWHNYATFSRLVLTRDLRRSFFACGCLDLIIGKVSRRHPSMPLPIFFSYFSRLFETLLEGLLPDVFGLSQNHSDKLALVVVYARAGASLDRDGRCLCFRDAL